MPDIIITSPFNKVSFINNHKKLWANANKKALKSYLKNSAFAIVMLLVCIFTHKEQGFPFAIALTSGFCFYVLMKWLEFFERRYNYFKLIKKQAQAYDQMNMACTCVLSDDWFDYTDNEKSFKFQWHLLKSYQHTGDTVIIGFNTGIYFPFDNEGIDNDTFIKACDFLKAKAEINIITL
ncbi:MULTISPECIES: hypothetical protein [unclassified Mucilaginibacter]|uniref:hypothetical protein n=1 Tax=unclassified Mucilaginibacter TaxID=2617802 RepID=UPI002AC8B45B|nr:MULTISPECIES: hypothetical protein [unclassified Mucilaginibacter]MEB0263399.1 hypothetical protein [Mucilaginibacter sp. 10I4]MEB0278572.1 hypothetical protein [Mucilaginibacter sp. 10B2]MEB0299283.1 hypothetical protein [Mucilaginibacter sp. 5C4]WPX23472.1 hypothetical protein RHM67_19540 [Mucilaginibacter sp. 5C4]